MCHLTGGSSLVQLGALEGGGQVGGEVRIKTETIPAKLRSSGSRFLVSWDNWFPGNGEPLSLLQEVAAHVPCRVDELP